MKKNNLIVLLPSLFLIAATLFACKNESKERNIERPGEAWVFRSVLDENPRMISIALHDDLWVAYSTETGGLYKAWQGGINFDGPVYTSAHGPQPSTLGITFMQEPVQNPWQIISNGNTVVPEVDYKGHIVLDNKITLKYNLIYNNQIIQVEEQPEYTSADGKKIGFERIFTTSNVPEGSEIRLNLNIGSLQSENDIETTGRFTAGNRSEQSIQKRNYLTVQGTLLLNNNDKTSIVFKFTPRPEIPAETKQIEGEEAVLALFAQSDCNTCHNIDVRTVGPAYIDIAKKYTNTAQVKENLIRKIIEGGAGNWGEIPMTPHPDLSKEDAGAMVSYILALDGSEEEIAAVAESGSLMPSPPFEISFEPRDPSKMDRNAENPGIAINFYQFTNSVSGFPENLNKTLPVISGVVNSIHFDEGDFGQFETNFVVHASGFINLKENTNLVLRLVSDDGSRLFIDDQMIIDNGGFHAMEAKDGEMNLSAGKHAFRVEYFQAGGGKGLSLQWHPHGSEDFKVIPPDVFTFKGSDIKKIQESPIAIKKRELPPGDKRALEAVHPSFDLAQARPDDFQPKVGGMDFLPDGRMVVSTWDSLGSVFILDGVQGNDPAAIKVKRIAYGLAEPLGLKVVDNEIYVMQKQELTRLIDHNNDDIIDEYQTVANAWRVSSNFHEFAFGLLYKDGFFYATLATAINPGGASTQPQIPDRGKVIKISKDGSVEFFASGLRTPNGIGFGVDKEIFIADNQGDWLPASKIVHLQEGKWYGSRSVDFEGTANFTEKLPVVWLPQDEIGNSPSQPALLDVGPYKNQMIHGEVTHGGIKRVFTEKVDGEYQGAVFRFSQGLEAGVNRLIWGPDGALYIGGVGSTGNWGHIGKLKYGLQKLTFNNKSTFEMLAVRAKSDGVEIEFTEPLKNGVGTNAADFEVKQWYYKPTAEYGGPKINDQNLKVLAVTVSEDRRRVFLKLAGMKPQHMIYLHLNHQNIKSENDQSLWSTEAWYNMNKIPKTSGLATR
ncbi:MAG: PA14 domain-containing protein [Bacteroidota bacterium]|nr:PA14 domain-containing protein [Bacteroidota bacterium]